MVIGSSTRNVPQTLKKFFEITTKEKNLKLKQKIFFQMTINKLEETHFDFILITIKAKSVVFYMEFNKVFVNLN